MLNTLKRHWPEYLMEAAGLGLFMISACVFSVLLFHPLSPIVHVIDLAAARRVLMGLAMGGTAVVLIYSPWGKQSGAHLNPAVTMAFFRLGKVSAWDSLFYSIAQIVGGLIGVVLMAWAVGSWLADPAINYVATVPGSAGITIAWLTEFSTSFLLMFVVLLTSNTPRLSQLTGVFAGVLIAANISLVAPLSGMSMNPARTLASAVPSGIWKGIWIYLTAPPAAMLLAAQSYLWWKGRRDSPFRRRCP
jgi:aquaporin Z